MGRGGRIMQDERTYKTSSQIGNEAFTVIMAVIFIGFLLINIFNLKISSSTCLISILLIGGTYYTIRLISKGVFIQRKKKFPLVLSLVASYCTWILISLLLKGEIKPLSLAGILDESRGYIIWSILFFPSLYYMFRYSKVRANKEAE